MTLNYPHPWQARIKYQVDGLTHIHQVYLAPYVGLWDIAPGQPASAYELDSVGTPDFDSWVNTYINGSPLHSPPFEGFKRWLTADGSIISVELWKYPPESNTGQFLTAVNMSEEGTESGSYDPASQIITTFRTQEGGIMRHVVMETTRPDNGQKSFSDLADWQQKFFTWQILDSGSPIIARDGSKPFAMSRLSRGQNEALFRKRYRS